jgi:hypothetical protein
MKRIPRRSWPWRGLQALYSPGLALTRLVEITPFAPFELKCALDAFPRPQYAYGLVQAARLAKGLGIDEFAALEFGVGKGGGLLALEELASQVARHLDVHVRIFGFDLGSGLPEPRDYRDSPYLFKGGQYRMDQVALQERLSNATLVLGDVEQTCTTFFEEYEPPPLGFMAFDLDYFSSTMSAFRLLETPDYERFLPRTLCYFDDIVGPDEACHSEFTGELLAIDKFNAAHEDRKISKVHGLRHKRITPCRWADQVYAFQLFNHPRFGQFIAPEGIVD